ncbi:phosphotransacetylase [Desulfosporosinus orientis DSM 765]|uniref:Phosphotransacetylase n=1 Tax=Desulfosporosinus orientis (strain ATCC 19365 / DSM 765 / NCIMB 8382 / VKM B-1628 / Singapore I) TaxID=768706 RepID=G7W6X3_DESOD|nr:phosphate acyltransferase [Desulfosporosinus orientis]AET69830.1 phosphotransacetylase [Desulfosporosinus orientis DSM 765]
MFGDFYELLAAAKKLKQVNISVAVAQEPGVLEAIKEAEDAGLAKAILVGDETVIRPMMTKIGLSEDNRVINIPDLDEAALRAVELVHNGEAQVLMKGLINTSNFMRAVLNREKGLRSGSILSHFAAFEIPGEKKLAFHADGGINVAPNLSQKRDILINSLSALKALGFTRPKVAVLAANEQVSPKMQATIDAADLVAMAQAGELPECELEGPMSMDIAASCESAEHKGIESKIAGDVDLFLFPTVEAGNLVAKTLIKYAKAKNAGIIMGATHPIVMVSRSNKAESKLNSLAMAALIVRGLQIN